jgi:hypothetical protein
MCDRCVFPGAEEANVGYRVKRVHKREDEEEVWRAAHAHME